MTRVASFICTLAMSSVSVSSAFIVSRPSVRRIVNQVESPSLTSLTSIRSQAICINKDLGTKLHVSGFDFLVETIIPSTVLITAFMAALQRLSTIDSSTPESYNWESTKMPWSDLISMHPFSTVSASETVLELGPMSEPQSLVVNKQLQVTIPSDNHNDNDNHTRKSEKANAAVSASPKIEIVQPSPPLRSTGGGRGRREDISTIKKTIASTLPSQLEKMERLKATEPKETIVEPSMALEIPVVSEAIEASVLQPLDVTQGTSKTSGRKRKFVAKILKKIVMPWKKWSSL